MTDEANVVSHGESVFSRMVQTGLKCGGVHVVASKNHGKSRLMFSVARELRSFENVKVYVFDGSETWLYAFDRIPTFTVKDRDIRLLNGHVQTTEEVERYAILNWSLIEQALKTYPSLLFRLKTRKPSKRGFFVRTVINYLDAFQREQRAETQDHEPKRHVAYFIEEAQDCFNNRSTTRLEAEEFLTVFNEARNQREAFFTASQRLTDFSKTIRTKQAYCIGKIPEEDKAIGIRRLEKQYSVDFDKLKARTWFFEGQTFTSPDWKQNGKPFQVNKEIKQEIKYKLVPATPRKKQSLLKRIIWSLIPDNIKRSIHTKPENREPEDDASEYDGILGISDDDALFPEED